jgi:hypothetical protein
VAANDPTPVGTVVPADVPCVSGTGVFASTACGVVALLARLATLHWPSFGRRGVPNSAVCSIGVAPAATAAPKEETFIVNCWTPVPPILAMQPVVPLTRPCCCISAMMSFAEGGAGLSLFGSLLVIVSWA